MGEREKRLTERFCAGVLGGGKRAEPEGKALNLPISQYSNSHLWS